MFTKWRGMKTAEDQTTVTNTLFKILDMAFTASSAKYHKNWLADFFHGFPHLNLSFDKINATFDPENADYQEVLAFWGGIPLIACALLWLAFLIFFCQRCCHKSEHKQRSTLCYRIFAGLFLLLGCGALATAFYGNAQLHSGMDGIVNVLKTTNRTVKDSLQVLHTIEKLANHTENKGVPALKRALEGITNVTARNKIIGLVNQTAASLDEAEKGIRSMRDDAHAVNTQKIRSQAVDIEYYRFLTTILVYSVYIAVFVFTFAGLLKKSKWMLMAVSFVTIGLMVIIWGMTSAYLVLSIGTGDLCVDPDNFVVTRVNKSGTVKGDILMDYIKCTDTSTPYQGQILDSQQKVIQAITALNKTVNMSQPFNISDKLAGPVNETRIDLNFVFGNLSSLTVMVGSCTTLHAVYILGVNSICNLALSGLGYLVLFSMLIGIFSAFMVLFAALSWPYLSRRRRGRGTGQCYAPVDDTDPFLPSPPPYPQNYGAISGAPLNRPRSQEDTSSTINAGVETRPIMEVGPEGDSPPPAYHPGHYMQQYYNLAPRPTSMLQSSSSEPTF